MTNGEKKIPEEIKRITGQIKDKLKNIDFKKIDLKKINLAGLTSQIKGLDFEKIKTKVKEFDKEKIKKMITRRKLKL